MSRRWLVAIVLVASLAGAAPAGARLNVSVDRTAVKTKLGRTFVIRSKITNRAPAPATGLVAHLNVLSLDGHVYVDPEDWSSHRTRYLPPIPTRGSTALVWKLEAVNDGQIGVYVAVLPRAGAGAKPATGPLVRVTIARRDTLNAGGILPLALGIPALLGLVAVALRARRTR
jgi:hypothetical protein